MNKILALVFLMAGSIWAGADPAYDAKLIHDYTARGYFVSVDAAEFIDQHTPGVLFPFRASWDSSPESLPFNQLVLKYHYQLNRALDRLPAYPKSEIYRGIYSTNTEDPPEKRFPKGRVWIERRFQSSTTSLKVAEQFAAGAYKNEGCGGCPPHVKRPNPRNMTLITILHRSGKDISVMAAEKGEKEVLLRSGLVFKVIDAKRDAKGRYVVKIQELDLKNLSGDDQKALAESEAKRLNKMVVEFYDGDSRKLQAAISDWNQLYNLSAAQGFYERDDFDWEMWETLLGG